MQYSIYNMYHRAMAWLGIVNIIKRNDMPVTNCLHCGERLKKEKIEGGYHFCSDKCSMLDSKAEQDAEEYRILTQGTFTDL